MFLDASIVVAILVREEDWIEQTARVESHRGHLFHSALVRFETALAVGREWQAKNPGLPVDEVFAEVEKVFDAFMADLGSQEIEISSTIGGSAVQAAQTYGKIVGHKAALNFGDCLSYASAKSLGTGLLYKGNDFLHTDLA